LWQYLIKGKPGKGTTDSIDSSSFNVFRCWIVEEHLIYVIWLIHGVMLNIRSSVFLNT
jgi:hypothetical protein